MDISTSAIIAVGFGNGKTTMNKNLKRTSQFALLAGSIAAIGMLTTALVVSRRPNVVELTLVQANVEAKPKQRKFSMGFRAYLIAKRWFDFIVAAMALVALSPLMAMIAVLIKLDSPGPVFFSQERVGSKVRGKNGKRSWEAKAFNVYKFRTMTVNNDASEHQKFVQAMIKGDNATLEQINGKIDGADKFKIKNDKRVTKIGKFLRKTSLDELPQLFNVIKGEMSIVGPRPAIAYEVDVYAPHHYRRLESQQGITGWWQATARSNVDFETMVELDAWYADNQSFWLDLKIMIMTPMSVLKGKGAA
jgi:lipopolysaccharide/colanic/teichoic acid biosynthesis glycosyltransferase